MERLLRSSFSLGHLGPELDPSSHDTVLLDRKTEALEVGTRKRLADVSCERTDLLEVGLSGKVEIVVSGRVVVSICV